MLEVWVAQVLPPRFSPADDPGREDEGLDTLVPDDSSKPYDMRDVISRIVDDEEFFEVHEHFAKNIVCGFSRLDGYPVGIVGNQPAHLAGVPAVDQAVTGLADDGHFLADARGGADLGYQGKICIHPRQVELAHEVFTPTPGEVAHARAVIVAHDDRGALEIFRN